MKMKNLLALLFALVFMLLSSVPSFAGEGELPPPPEQEETDPVQPPEDGAEPDPDPAPEPEEPPVSPDDPGDPGDKDPEEPPAVEDPDDPEEPEAPSEGDSGGEDPEDDPGEEGPGPGEDGEDGGDTEEDGEDEDGGAEDAEQIINVFVPSSGQVVINPYGMKVDAWYGETREQIVHEPQELTNFGDFPVLVSAQVTGTLQPWSEARFADAPPAEDGTDKEIFMYMEFQPMMDSWEYGYGDRANQILVTEHGLEKEDVMTLEAFGTGYFRLFGAMTPYPASMWTEDDTADVTVAFTFTPAEDAAGEWLEEEVPELRDVPVDREQPWDESGEWPEEDLPELRDFFFEEEPPRNDSGV